MKGKYIDATQDQPALISRIKEIEQNELYVMTVKQFSTGKENPYSDPPKTQ